MLKNYFIIAMRNLARHKVYTFINIVGLAIGLACSILILLFLQNEFSYDCHHSNADRIYRVIHGRYNRDGNLNYLPTTWGPFAPARSEEFPEVERATRLMRHWSAGVSADGNAPVNTQRLYVVDDEFFKVFDFPLISGDLQTGLQTPYSIFMTQSFSKTLFGDEDPMGKTVFINSKYMNHTYTITGILQDAPRNGYNRDGLLIQPLFEGAETLKTQFLQHPDISHATITSIAPFDMNERALKYISSDNQPEAIPICYLYSDVSFLDTYQIPLLSGRNFVAQDIRPVNWTASGEPPRFRVLLNESAAKHLKA